MSKEAIILAGGFGTRLGELTKNTPKPLVPINGRPFLDILLNYLISLGFEKVVLSTGHLSDQIQARYHNQYRELAVKYAIEESPLGTGGAIRHALSFTEDENVFVMNGDSFLEFDKNAVESIHIQANADITLVLREVEDASRFGSILLNKSAKITDFKEKSNDHLAGLINGGVYLINKKSYLNHTSEGSFSIEKDVFQAKAQELSFYSCTTSGFFIDIGVPTDYNKAQDAFKRFEY